MAFHSEEGAITIPKENKNLLISFIEPLLLLAITVVSTSIVISTSTLANLVTKSTTYKTACKVPSGPKAEPTIAPTAPPPTVPTASPTSVPP